MDNKNEVIFNIITRTSNRPNYFSQCQESITKQVNIDNITVNRYITFDDENDLSNYIEKFARDNKNVTVIEVTKPIRKNRQHFPYNLYLNEVFPHIKSGWNIILNDDTYFNNDNTLSIIAKKIKENGTNYVYLWNCNKLGKICPNSSSEFKQGDVHLSCFAFHSSKYKKVLFPNKNCNKLEDELYIFNNLINSIKCVYINDTLTATDNLGEGLRKDNESFKQKVKVKINFNTENSEHVFDKNESPNKISLSIAAASTPAPVSANINDRNEDETEDGSEDESEEEIEEEDQEDLIESNTSVSENESELKKLSDADTDADASADVNEEDNLNDDCTSTDEEDLNENVDDLNETNLTQINKLSGDSSNILSQLVQLLNQNHSKIYILTDTHMKALAQCFYESVEYEKKSEQLISILENNYFQLKTNILNKKLRDITLSGSSTSTTSEILDVNDTVNINKKKLDITSDTATATSKSSDSLKKKKTSKQDTEVPSPSLINNYISNIYVIVDNDSNKNIQLTKNKLILDKSGYKYEVVTIKDMSLSNFQKKISDKLSEAKSKGYEKVLFLNGNDLLNIKFKYILETQIENIKSNSYNVGLWLMGNTNDFSQKDILNTKFNLEVYTNLYDDIVNAKIITEEKAKHHWKQYGNREGRYASINIYNNRPSLLNGLSGILISEELFDDAIQLINKSSSKSVFSDMQNNPQMKEFVFSSYPELIIPSTLSKNAQAIVKYGWYLNLYLGALK
jgi:hypothetical protein